MHRFSLLSILLTAPGVATFVTAPAQATSYFSFSIGGPGYHLKYGFSGSQYGFPGYYGYPRYHFPYDRPGWHPRGYRHYHHKHDYGGPRSYSGFWTYRGFLRYPGYRYPHGYHNHQKFNRHYGQRGHGYKRYHRWKRYNRRHYGYHRW